MELTKISTERRTLGDQVYSYLRELIITLQLKPGQMVYENELANSLDVSRTPIREAFRMLLSEEFIEILPQRGARIAHISKRKVEEAWFVRTCLEASAFKEAAKRWNSEDAKCKLLQEEVTRIIEAQKNAELADFYRLDEEFHLKMLKFSDNNTLITLIMQMRGHINRIIYLELQETKNTQHVQSIISDHEQILRAVTSNDIAETEKMLTEHLNRFPYNFSKLIENYPDYFC